MGRNFFRIAISWMIVLLLAGSMQPAAAAPLPGPVPAAALLGPKNIIIMIGDGMGYNHSLAASYYRFGEKGKQVYASFPIQYAMTTYPADGWGYNPLLAWTDFTYVMSHATDSAAGATAMATGVKTNEGLIGVDPSGKALVNWFQSAEKAGKATGVVTTVEISDATPAGVVAHTTDRNASEAIAQEMILQSKTDVIMGAGSPDYNDNGLPVGAKPNTHNWVGGEALWSALQAGAVVSDTDGDGLDETATLIQDRSAFQALMNDPNPPERVVGVMHAYSASQQNRCRDLSGNPITTTPTSPCPAQYLQAAAYAVPRNSEVPSLSEEALGAINVLARDRQGFALVVEGGAIDHAAVASQAGRMIEEQIDFDEAVEGVVNWVETRSSWEETLLIVAADHESGYLWGPGSGQPRTWAELVNNGKGKMPGMQFYEPAHSNSLVRLYAKGAAASNFSRLVAGTDPRRGAYIDNTSIAKVIFELISYSQNTIYIPLLSVWR